MVAYLAKVKMELSAFWRGLLEQIPREQNAIADALAKLAISGETEDLGLVPVEFLEKPSIEVDGTEVEMIDARPSWITPILEYLVEGKLPEGHNGARRVLYQAPRYTIVDGVLYRRGHSLPLLRCVLPDEAKAILQEVHEGFCGDHAGGQSLALKVLR